MLLCAYVVWCPWFRWDHDFFQGDVLAVALSFDLALPIAQDPCTTLVLPLYVALRVAHGAILRSHGSAR